MQFEQTMEVDEAFLGRCLLLRLNCSVVAFGHAGAATLPLNMVDSRLRQTISSVVGGCYEFLCDTLPQPLILTIFRQTVVMQHPVEVVRH